MIKCQKCGKTWELPYNYELIFLASERPSTHSGCGGIVEYAREAME